MPDKRGVSPKGAGNRLAAPRNMSGHTRPPSIPNIGIGCIGMIFSVPPFCCCGSIMSSACVVSKPDTLLDEVPKALTKSVHDIPTYTHYV